MTYVALGFGQLDFEMTTALESSMNRKEAARSFTSGKCIAVQWHTPTEASRRRGRTAFTTSELFRVDAEV